MSGRILNVIIINAVGWSSNDRSKKSRLEKPFAAIKSKVQSNGTHVINFTIENPNKE